MGSTSGSKIRPCIKAKLPRLNQNMRHARFSREKGAKTMDGRFDTFDDFLNN
jgi:hypothetical protein